MKPAGLKKKLLEALEKKRQRASEVQKASIDKKEESSPKIVSKLQSKMQKKLSGSKFRWLNESLYTKDSAESFKLFSKDPELFKIYHEGFSTQVKEWPLNPVDIFIKYLETKPKSTVIADMGCGVAQIAKTLHEKMTVHSFDLVAGNEFITACDIANVPLKSSTVDVVVFALSLMGTNFTDFLVEAKRILNENGELLVAEVVSRIPNLEEFINGIETLGFKLMKKETKKMFVLLNFTVSKTKSGTPNKLILKPCIYKRR